MAVIVITSGLGLLSDALEIMSIGFAKEYIAKEFKVMILVNITVRPSLPGYSGKGFCLYLPVISGTDCNSIHIFDLPSLF